MRLLLVVTLYFLSLTSIFSQDIEDIRNWMDKTRSTNFYKIEVREYGIYSISQAELQAAGYNINGDTSKIKMYRRGKEVAIKINFDGSTINSIEFYGEPNDGDTDKYIYRNENDHKEHSLPIYSYTAAYFLSAPTITNGNNKRITEINTSSSGAVATDYHWYTETYNNTPTEKSFNFRTSFSQGESVNRDRTSFSSSFRGPRSWTTYNTNKKTGIVSFQLRVNNLYGSINSDNNFKLESSIMNFAYNRRANVTFNVGNTAGNTSPKVTKQISDYDEEEFSILLNQNDFANGSTHVLLEDSFNGTGSDNNQLGVLYFNLTYPQSHSAISLANDLAFSIISNQKQIISAPQASSSNFYNITDPTSPKVYRKNNSSSRDQSIVDINSTATNIYFSASTKAVASISRATFEFTNSSNNNYDYLIISHPELMKASSSYSDPVEAYASYRRNTFKNEAINEKYNVYVADINKLYNTFSWGEYTPQAIRNCINVLRPKESTSDSLQYVFIIGKGLDLNYDAFETTPSGARAYHYVPTYGYPGGDNTFTMGFKDNTGATMETGVLPVGRIAAHTPQVVEDYLNKIIEHENLAFDALWRKKALHLSGGSNEYQQEEFKRIINKYGTVFMDTLEGGSVQTISRESDGSIEFIDVSDIVNEGISLMTFFGHSSAQSADIDIGYASDPTKGYANQGKYPFIMMSGCGGGNLFTHEKSWGEDWIETPAKGAVGFMAKSGLGSQFELETFGNDFYEQTFEKQIGYQIGRHMLATHQLMLQGNPRNLRFSTVEQYGLQGDPALRISPNKVDFSIQEDQITIIPQDGSNLNSNDDFYRLKLTVNNFGHTYTGKLYIEVRRQYGNGIASTNTYIDSLVAPFNNVDTLFTIANSTEDQQHGNGLNQITIKIGDQLSASGTVENTIEEISLLNNTATVSTNFFSERASIIFPQNFATVHDDIISFYAFDYSLENKENTVIFQLALDSAFTNVVYPDGKITSNQLFKWGDIPLTSQEDTTVYYLRTKLENTDRWDVISFTKIRNSSGEGWNQSSIFEMQQNRIDGAILTGNETDLKWEFPVDAANISVKAAGASYTNGYFYEVNYDGETYLVDGTCLRRGDPGDKLIFLVFDQFTGSFKGAQTYIWGPLQCGEGYPPVAVMFNSLDIRGGNTSSSAPKTRNGPYSLFIDPVYKFASIEKGDYVLTIMAGNFDFQGNLPTDPKKLDAYHKHLEGFAEAGLDTLDMQTNLTQSGLAFIGWSRFQMDPSLSQVYYATQTNQLLQQNFNIQKDVTTATVTTSPIGPSKQFSRLWVNAELPGTFSQVETTIFGVTEDENGNISTPDSITTIKGISDNNGFDLGTFTKIKNYDFISLKSFLMDTSASRQIPQLDNWRVSYTPVAEGVMISRDNDTPEKLQQGQNTSFEYEFHNVSTHSFSDKILVEINYNSDRNSFIDSVYLPPLSANSMSEIKVTTDTWQKNNPDKRLSGNTSVTTIANKGREQLELFYNNNNSRTENFYVTEDSLNPLVEVLFDGTRIISGDIVSPSAEISISLKDENPYIPLDDNMEIIKNGEEISIINVTLTPEKESAIQLDLTNSSTQSVGDQNHIINTFQINEAIPTEHSSEIIDEDGLLSSGRYKLEVNAMDPSENNSGYGQTDDKAPKLTIDFEINKEASITNFYPYPNPFSDKVRFVFQVTGIDVPQQIKIQIMTVTGRVVKEIFKEELGPIRVGNNITEYAWDGKDEFGDQLANGVYLYRVIIPDKNDGTFKHNERSADYMFKHNIGKLYLLR